METTIHAPVETEDEYLVREPQADYRSEFRDGRVVAMSGGTPRHALIITNLVAAIHPQLRGRPCQLYASDLRVKVAAAHFYTYPDIAVVCGTPQFDAKDKNALTNPTAIIEVLSESTEAYDRGEKFGYYKRLASLQEYVLVRQDQAGFERHALIDGEWKLDETVPPAERLELQSIGCGVVLSDVYEKVQF